MNNIKEIGTGSIHLVDKTDARNAIFISLFPNCFTLWFNTAYSAENGNSAIEYAQRTFYLNGKINVSRGIDDIDAVFLVVKIPGNSGGSRSNRNAALLFLYHPVHGSRAIMNFAEFIITSGIIQYTLSRRGFTRVDMGHDAYISRMY